MIPHVISINVSRGGIPKQSVESARVTFAGLEGDGHNHEKHRVLERAVTLQDIERLDDLRREGYPVFTGATGENLTVRHLDVNNLPPGAILEFSGGVVLKLVKMRKPCYVLDVIDPKLKDDIVGRCGVCAQVLKEGVIKPEETIQVSVPCSSLKAKGGENVRQKVEGWIGGRRVFLVMAATTGLGVRFYLDLSRQKNVRLIVVVANRLGNPRWQPFHPKIRKEIEEKGGVVVEEGPWEAVLRVAPMVVAKYIIPLFGYKQRSWEELLAIGGRVCLQIAEIAVRKNLIRKEDTIVAVAGRNTALALKVTNLDPPQMALLDIIFREDIQLA